MFSLLEGDGVIENLFHLLWTKDSIFGRDSYVLIPDTVIFKYQKPCYWYFTSKKDNKLRKKSTLKLSIEAIKNSFTENISNSGIIAYYLYKKQRKPDKYNEHKKGSEKDNDQTFNFIEYFDINTFNDFFNNISHYSDGILQKFEDPKGNHNSILRLIWSPKICIFEKKTNIKPIFDKKYNIYERAVTYDGEEFQTKTESIMGNNLPDRLEKIGNSVASHISNVTLERIKIARMILNFKILENDTIVLLWCSSLRLENSLDKKGNNNQIQINEYTPCEMNKIKINLSEKINLFKYSVKGKPIWPLKDSICDSCQHKIETNKLTPISFQYLIESHENQKKDKKDVYLDSDISITPNGVEILHYSETKNYKKKVDKEKLNAKREIVKNYLIPKAINYIFPKLKYEEYLEFKEEDVFLSKKALVCENCYLDTTRYCFVLGTNFRNYYDLLNINKIKNKKKLVVINEKTESIVKNNLPEKKEFHSLTTKNQDLKISFYDNKFEKNDYFQKKLTLPSLKKKAMKGNYTADNSTEIIPTQSHNSKHTYYK